MLTLLADIYVAHGDGGAINLLVNLLIWAIILGLIWWVLSILPLPAPVKQIITVVFVVIVALVAIDILLGFTGHPLFR